MGEMVALSLCINRCHSWCWPWSSRPPKTSGSCISWCGFYAPIFPRCRTPWGDRPVPYHIGLGLLLPDIQVRLAIVVHLVHSQWISGSRCICCIPDLQPLAPVSRPWPRSINSRCALIVCVLGCVLDHSPMWCGISFVQAITMFYAWCVSLQASSKDARWSMCSGNCRAGDLLQSSPVRIFCTILWLCSWFSPADVSANWCCCVLVCTSDSLVMQCDFSLKQAGMGHCSLSGILNWLQMRSWARFSLCIITWQFETPILRRMPCLSQLFQGPCHLVAMVCNSIAGGWSWCSAGFI